MKRQARLVLTDFDHPTPEMLLQAYRAGIFPMAVPEMANAICWFSPDPRAIIPLDEFHASKSLLRTVRQQRFEVVSDRDFAGVIRGCAAPRPQHPGTWLSEEMIQLYTQLHKLGWAHSIECYCCGELAGGVYGIALGGAFCGESMFYRARDASKVALFHLVRHLRRKGYTLLDVQYLTPHLRRFGAREIPRSEYEGRLQAALEADTTWNHAHFDPS